MRRNGVAVLAAVLALSASSGAAGAPGTVQQVDTIVPVTGLTSLMNDANAVTVVANNYKTNGDGGRGTFVLAGTDCSSSPYSADDGVAFQGAHGCYYRQFTGTVHLKWYGVTSSDESASDLDSLDVSDQLTKALVAAALSNPGGIITPATRVVNFQIAAGGGIVLDETDTHCTNLSAGVVNPMTPGSLGFVAVNGCFSINSMRSNLVGASDWLLESGGSQAVTGTIVGVEAPQTTIYGQDASIAPNLSCANNLLAAQSPCNNALPRNLDSTGAAPACDSGSTGCSSVSGTNNAMAVTLASGATSAVVDFAGAGFNRTPTCMASSRSTTLRAAVTSTTATSITVSLSAGTPGPTIDVLCVGH